MTKPLVMFLLSACLSLLFVAKAQPNTAYYEQPRMSGIYISATDYQHHKLTLPVNCDTARSRIRMNDFWDRPHITVVYSGKKYTFLKDTIFGLRNCEGYDFRLFHRRLFEIAERKTLIIYKHLAVESGGSTKGIRQVIRYYFSTDVNAPILPLTRPVVESVFARNEKLHDLLEAYFHNNHYAISAYDSYHHTFKINQVLQAAM